MSCRVCSKYLVQFSAVPNFGPTNETPSYHFKQVNLARERGGDSIGCISTDGMFSSSADRLALTRTALLRRPHPDRQQALQVYYYAYTCPSIRGLH